MLRFTPEQAQVIISNRRAFNNAQTAMAEMHGTVALGNAFTLPKDVWGDWDREAVELQRSMNAVFNDLAASVAAPMSIAKLVHFFQRVSDSGEANVTLDGRSKARRDRQVIDYQGTPLPITDSTFGYGWREMAAAASEGFQLDDAGRMNAMRTVMDRMESMVLNGETSIVVGGNQLYGLRTHPKRNTRSTGVTLNGATGAQWLAEFVATLGLLHADNFKVPATIYMNWGDWFYANNTDFSTAYPNKTIIQRLLESGGIKEIIPSDSLAANEIIAIVKDRRVVRILNGMPLSTRAQFRANPEDDYNFVTMMAAALEVKFDYEDNCGIAHSS